MRIPIDPPMNQRRVQKDYPSTECQHAPVKRAHAHTQTHSKETTSLHTHIYINIHMYIYIYIYEGSSILRIKLSAPRSSDDGPLEGHGNHQRPVPK